MVNREKSAALGKSILWGVCILLFPILSGTLSAVLSLETVETLILQGVFMLLSLTVPCVFIFVKKWNWSEIGFSKIDRGGCKKAAYFLPLLAVFVPVAVEGFSLKSAAYVWSNLFLYCMVGLAEEVYFRGIIPKYLNRAFSRKGMMVLSTLIFGIGHIASAFTVGSGLEIFLSVLNACIFGWLAIEMAVICKNIVPGILLHALFDFETKIVVMQGQALLIAECARGAVMVLAAIWLGTILARSKATE